MKTDSYFLGSVALVVAAAATIAMGCPSIHPKEPFSHYYNPDDGREIPLVLVATEIAYELRSGISEEERNAALSAISETFDAPSSPTDEQVLGLVAALNLMNGVEWASPIVIRDFSVAGIYCQYCEGAVRVEPYFIAEFPAETPVSAFDALNAAYSVEGTEFERNEQVVVYRLRVTPASDFSTIETANLYHEAPLTLRAYPTFTPVWEF